MDQSNSAFDDESSLFDDMDLAEAPEEYMGSEEDVEMDVSLPPSAFSDDSWTLDDFEDLLTGF